jgi:hypothetical protein
VVTRRRSVGLVVAASVLVATLGATVATAQQDDAAPQGSDDAALLTRLDALEPQLPAELAPTTVVIDPEASWGSFEGDVTGAAATLGTLERDLLALYVDADDADTPVADAVAQISRGWLDLQQAYEQLAAWEAADLEFPLDSDDAQGIATDADELAGRAETGLRIVLDASQRQRAGYVALRELGAADPAAQQRLDARAAASDAFDADVRPLIGELLALRSTAVLVPVERFGSSAPGVEARARTMTVSCIDRQAIDDIAADVQAGETALLDGISDLMGSSVVRQDCPGLAEEQDVRELD